MTAELEQNAKLQDRLDKMEARVLHGGENMVDKNSQLKQLVEATEAQVEVQRCAPAGTALQ